VSFHIVLCRKLDASIGGIIFKVEVYFSVVCPINKHPTIVVLLDHFVHN